MGAGDLLTKKISHDSWDKGETVTIREMTALQEAQLTSAAMGNQTLGDLDSEDKIAQLSLGEMSPELNQMKTLEYSIEKWTLTRSGKVMVLNLENIQLIKGSVADYIMEEIDKLIPKIDADFPGESVPVVQDGEVKDTG